VVTCSRCGSVLRVDDLFCGVCGTGVPVQPVAPADAEAPGGATDVEATPTAATCWRCGTAYEADGVFCAACGAGRPPTPAPGVVLAPADGSTVAPSRAPWSPVGESPAREWTPRAEGPPLRGRRRGRTAAVIAVLVVVILVAGGIVGNAVLSGVTSPVNTAVAWVQAMGAGKASTAWDLMAVSAGSSSGSSSLLTKAALATSLKGGIGGPFRDVHAVGVPTVLGKSATVSVSYEDSSGGTQRTTLTLTQDRAISKYLFYPTWKVALSPYAVSVAEVAGELGPMTVNGIPVAAASGTNAMTLLLLPGQYDVEVAASGLYEPASASVNVSLDGTSASTNDIKLQSQLAAAALASAKKVVSQLFTQCAQSTSSSPNGCPQSLGVADWSSYAWQLEGDPTVGLTITPAGSGAAFDASGTYVMLATTPDSDSPGESLQDVSAGPYEVALTWTGSAFTGSEIAASSSTVTAPSAVTDSDVLTAIGNAFTACAADGSSDPANCPQGYWNVTDGDNGCQVSWSLQGNAADQSASQVTFDTSADLYDVTGSYAMNYSINMNTGDCANDAYADYATTGNVNGTYAAEAVWNGTKVIVVYINDSDNDDY